MAAFDAGSHLTGNSVSTLSWTHTPVGTPTGIYLGIFSRRSAAVVGDQPSSAPTYGGTAMTLVGTVSDATSLIRWTWYYLAAPISGAQTVSVTFGGTSQLGCGGVAYSVTGDSGANPSASLASAAGNSTTASVTPVAPASTDLVLFAGASNTASAGFTTGAGMSAGQVQVFVDNSGNNDWDADYRPGSSGSAALTHTVTTGTWFASTINVPGAVAAAGPVPFRPILPMLKQFGGMGTPLIFMPQSFGIDSTGFPWTLNLADTITLSDAIAKAIGPNEADTITLSDALSRTVAFIRNPADTLTLSDALVKAVTAPLADTITLSDAVSKTITLAKSDTITLSDSIAKTLGLNKADTVTLSDALAKAVGVVVGDTITLSDVAVPTLTPGGGTNWTLNLADTITLSETFHRILTDEGIPTATASKAREILLSKFGVY